MLVAAAVVGGGLWVVRWVAGQDALLWPGAVLLTVVALGLGAALVRPVPLRVVVGGCLALLCWSLAVVLGLDGEAWRGGVVGAAAVLAAALAWARTRTPAGAAPYVGERRRAGAHAR